MQNITLLLGPNRYALRKEKMRWIQEFKKRQGEDSLLVCAGASTSFKALQAECQVAPFLAQKRLIVVDGVPPRSKKEDVEALRACMHPQVVLLFVHTTEPGKSAKLTGAVKELAEAAQVIEFPMLASSKLLEWIEAEACLHGATGCAPDARSVLVQRAGEDQEALEQEIAKMATYAHGRQILVDDVQLLLSATAERDVWRLMDFLGSGDSHGAVRYVYNLLDHGYSPQALWSMFLWMVTLLTQIVAMTEEGETNPWKIAGTVRANPSGVKAILPFARRVKRETLARIVQTILDHDIGIKTGVFRATNESPEELLVLIDRSLLLFKS